LLDYDETSVKMCGPTATDPTTVEQEEWRETFETVEAGERIRAALTPRLTGTPASFRLQISCTDTSDGTPSGFPSRNPVVRAVTFVFRGQVAQDTPPANEVLHAAIARLMQMQPPAVAGAPGT
jgi:hypothetical protein